jgi:D-lactate dehydrogenase
MKVFVYSARPYDRPALQAATGQHELLFTEKKLSLESARDAAGCQAVSIFTCDDASANILEALYTCGIRYLLLRSVGYDHVDLEKTSQLGMRVANVPEYSPYAVAEHAVAMLMAVNRKLIQGQQLMHLQDFRIDSLKGFDVHGKTVGVIGTGKIGMAFCRIMLGFGASVIAYDPKVSQEAIDLKITYVSMEELIRRSDIVSLHCPLNGGTKHLISRAQFGWMKETAILINTSRGAIVNTDDLIYALDAGRLGGACLDVYEFEKNLFFEDHTNDVIHDVRFARLRNFKNVLVTSHQGFLTNDAIKQIAETTIGNLDCFQNERVCQNELVHEGDKNGSKGRHDKQTISLL